MAQELGIPVTQRIDDVIEAGVELGVVVAFGRIIKDEILERVPMVNAHFSLLPRWRGAAPVERAILAGDAETGVCLMAIDSGLDTGSVYACERVPIGAEETAQQLRERLAGLGASMLVDALATGLGDPVPQQGDPTYADKIEPEDLHLQWSRPAEELHRVVRVGRAWTTWRAKRLLVHRAQVLPAPAPGGRPGELIGDVVATGTAGLRLLEVQPEGRAAIQASDWVRGARPVPGEMFGT